MIKKLPKNIINVISAGEVVERPASIVKELIENSIDAGATKILINIEQGGNKLIKVQDNGEGIAKEDIELTIERYATSKINNMKDIDHIKSFGFRGEALASIAEVSKFTLQSKTSDSAIGQQLKKIENLVNIEEIPVSFEYGTNIIIEDIFFNVAVRKKYLKTQQTEYKYIYNTVLDFALDKHAIEFHLIHNNKTTLQVASANSLWERILQIYPSSWWDNLVHLDFEDSENSIYGVISKPILKFNTPLTRIFINSRPVEDRIIKKAIMQAYSRWIQPSSYPFVILFLDMPYDKVDINVHPRKKEVKFQDPGSIYQMVYNTVKKHIENPDNIDNKISSTHTSFSKNNYRKHEVTSGSNILNFGKKLQKERKNQIQDYNGELEISKKNDLGLKSDSEKNWERNWENPINWDYEDLSEDPNFQIIGQIFDSYILAQKEDKFIIIDQHAVAERIIFEKMRKDLANNQNNSILLTPITKEIKKTPWLEEKFEKLQNLGFDISLFGENKVIVYAIPEIFEKYQVNIEFLLDGLIYSDIEDLNIDRILEQIFATKACKAAIKANHKLSIPEMEQLIKDGIEKIDGFFVCQHGRPSVVSLEKNEIDGMFDR